MLQRAASALGSDHWDPDQHSLPTKNHGGWNKPWITIWTSRFSCTTWIMPWRGNSPALTTKKGTNIRSIVFHTKTCQLKNTSERSTRVPWSEAFCRTCSSSKPRRWTPVGPVARSYPCPEYWTPSHCTSLPGSLGVYEACESRPRTHKRYPRGLRKIPFVKLVLYEGSCSKRGSLVLPSLQKN